MPYAYGKGSNRILETTDMVVQRVFRRAIMISSIDFSFISGKRYPAEQLQLYIDGDSQLNGIPKGVKSGNVTGTGVSMHQLGFAGDVVAWVEGESDFKLKHFIPIAEAVQKACRLEGVEMIWGGCWDKPLTKCQNVRSEMNRYKRRRLSMGKKPFIDAGHFQLERRL